MTISTVTVRRKGDPQHMLRGKDHLIYIYLYIYYHVFAFASIVDRMLSCTTVLSSEAPKPKQVRELLSWGLKHI